MMKRQRISQIITVICLTSTARLVPGSEIKEVAIDPPNIRTGPGKKGHTDSILFSKASYNSIGDPFKGAALSMVRKEDRAAQIAVGNEKPFKPQNHVRQPTNATYPHMKEFEHVQKNFRDPEDNRSVLVGPRNFLVNPPKKGIVGKNTTFSGVIPYMADDYNIPKELAKKERLKGQALM